MDISNSSPFSVALKSINNEFQKIAEQAGKIAGYALEENTPSTTSLAEPLIEIGRSEDAIVANFKVIQTLNKMEEEVLNIIA